MNTPEYLPYHISVIGDVGIVMTDTETDYSHLSQHPQNKPHSQVESLFKAEIGLCM